MPMHHRTRFVMIAVVTLAACGGGRPTASGRVPPNGPGAGWAEVDAGQVVGGPGTICAVGRMSQDPTRAAHACNPRLSCCYPCGIDGCDSVCMADCGPPRP